MRKQPKLDSKWITIHYTLCNHYININHLECTCAQHHPSRIHKYTTNTEVANHKLYGTWAQYPKRTQPTLVPHSPDSLLPPASCLHFILQCCAIEERVWLRETRPTSDLSTFSKLDHNAPVSLLQHKARWVLAE